MSNVVLVTSLTEEVRSVAQHYRDRGDAENNFDELKNQWGWAGFTTQDRKRCQINGADHGLGIQLVDDLHALGNRGQTCRSDHLAATGTAWHRAANAARESDHCEITSTHAEASKIAKMLTNVSAFLAPKIGPKRGG